MADAKSSQDKKDQEFSGHQAIHPPSIKCLTEIAKDLNFNLDDNELKEHQEAIAIQCETFQRIYNLPEPKLPVKYARRIGYHPKVEENPFNAWYWRCDISGAPNGKLHGKTIAIKDNISVAGIPMMNGSHLLDGYIADIDASVVTRVLDEGGQILGKAVCENISFSGGSLTAANGLVRNPWDTTRMSGGSSSGCAVLVANKDVDMAIGGDQGGSIRIPSAACGIVGLKPTHGLVPYTGIMSIEATLDHTGPMARTVYDTALLLEVLAGYDNGLDHRQPRDLKIPSYTNELTSDIKGLRVGLLKEGFTDIFESDVKELVRKSAERLIEKGAMVEEVSIPWHLHGNHLLFGILASTSTNLFEGENSNTQGYHNTHLQIALNRGFKCHPNETTPNIKSMLLCGRYLGDNNYRWLYSKCQNLRRDLRQAYDEAFKKYDVLIMPTIPKKASQFPSKNPSLSEYLDKSFEMTGNTASFDVSGHPALSINAGFSQGLPVGMMIAGKMFDELTVLKVAYAFEQLRDINV